MGIVGTAKAFFLRFQGKSAEIGFLIGHFRLARVNLKKPGLFMGCDRILL